MLNVLEQFLLDTEGAVDVSRAFLKLNDLYTLFALDPARKKLPVNCMTNDILACCQLLQS